MQSIKTIWVALIVVAIIAIGGYAYPHAGALLGRVGTQFPHGITIGDTSLSASNLSKKIVGTCNPTFSGTSLAASSSGQFFCTVTGARSGDNIRVTLPVGAGANAQGAGSIYGGFVLSGAYATTSDVIGLNITNFTGAATSSFIQATTTVQYEITTTQ
jgi:hypothetical protein